MQNIKESHKNDKEDNYLNIFIVAHKDFDNHRYNPVYKIIANDPSKLKNKYELEVLYCDKNSRLYDMDLANSEMSKIYHIFNIYKNGEISSIYIGINHYRRYFSFLDDIPDLDDIFKEYDVILSNKFYVKEGSLKENYYKRHLKNNYDEMIEIIKNKRPEYYQAAIEASNSPIFFPWNIFIMKKQDFLNYCEFIFEILFEFDKRHNFNKQKDVEEYTKKYFQEKDVLYQQRIQAFLSERISTIFHCQYFNFSKIKIIKMLFEDKND